MSNTIHISIPNTNHNPQSPSQQQDPDREKQLNDLLGSITTEQFHQFVQLGKMIHDFGDDAGAGEGEGALDEDIGVAVEFEDEDDEDDEVDVIQV